MTKQLGLFDLEPSDTDTEAPPSEAPERPLSNFERKRQARVERLENAAAAARQEAKRRSETADRMSSVIPFGQPILVGHHSERRDRNYRERIHQNMRKASEARQQADEFERRAEAARNNTAIFSDDPDASEKIDARIKRLEQRQELMKKANALVRKADRAGLAELGFSESTIAQLFTPDFVGRLGYPPYLLSNNNANIRRLKQRQQKLERQANDVTTTREIAGVEIVDNVEGNRLQIFFPGKPAPEVRKELKARGFRWAPSEGAWQRHRSADATYWAEMIVKKYYWDPEEE